MSVLRWSSTNPVSVHSGRLYAPSTPTAIPDLSITLVDCPPRRGARRASATVTLDFGPTEPPVAVTLTVDGASQHAVLDFSRVGKTSEWRATGDLRTLREGQSVGLQWSSTSGAPSFGGVTLSVVATDWGDVD